MKKFLFLFMFVISFFWFINISNAWFSASQYSSFEIKLKNIPWWYSSMISNIDLSTFTRFYISDDEYLTTINTWVCHNLNIYQEYYSDDFYYVVLCDNKTYQFYGSTLYIWGSKIGNPPLPLSYFDFYSYNNVDFSSVYKTKFIDLFKNVNWIFYINLDSLTFFIFYILLCITFHILFFILIKKSIFYIFNIRKWEK